MMLRSRLAELERIERASALAASRAREEAITKAQIEEHAEHLRTINGSQEKMLKAQAAMATQLASVITRLAIYNGIAALIGAIIVGVAIFLITGQVNTTK